MESNVQFFFKNVEKLDEAPDAKKAAHNYVLYQLRLAAIGLGLECSGTNYNHRHFEVPRFIGVGAYYTLVFNTLLTSQPKLRIAIELRDTVFDHIGKIDLALEHEISKSGFLYKTTKQAGAWLRYIEKEYVLTMQEIEELSYTVVRFIQEDFQAIMDVILMIVKEPECS